MRLLFLTHNTIGYGGSYQRAFSLARALDSRGHKCTLIGGRPHGGLRIFREVRSGVKCWGAPDVMPLKLRHGGLSPLDTLWRLIFVRGLEVDLVHSFDHRPSAMLPAWWLNRSRGVVWVSDWADLWGRGGIADTRGPLARNTLGAWDHLAEGPCRRKADGVTVVNSYLGQRARELGVDPSRVKILPPGADADLLRLVDKAKARRWLGMQAENRVVAHIGYAPYDEALLVETLVMLASAPDPIRILTTGREPSGLRARLSRVGAGDRWTHFGTLPYAELDKVLSAADVLLLPYSGKTVNLGRFPNKLGDYLAAGRPVVTNPTGDMARLVDEHEIGLAVDETPGAMAAGVIRLLAEGETAESMGVKAKALAAGEWAWSSRASETEAFYEELLNDNRRPSRSGSGSVAGGGAP